MCKRAKPQTFKTVACAARNGGSMTEKIQELRDTLAHLHEQLENHAPLEAESKALLLSTIQEINEALERAGSGSGTRSDADEEEPTLLDRLGEMTEDFEENYPAISSAIGRVATALSNLGI
jgi:hypothetical protein